MKKNSLNMTLALLPLSCLASSVDTRDETINHIEILQVGTSVFPPDSTFLTDMLRPAMRVNPEVKKNEWDEIRREASAAVSRAMTQFGSMMNIAYRASLEPLSDTELDRLAVLLSNPVWIKSTAAIAAPATQQKVIKARMTNAEQMSIALNTMLAKQD